MARKPCLHVPGGLYHVILRGNARQDIFFTPEDRRRFYELMAQGVARFGYRVHAFCLMTNHLHLALQAQKNRVKFTFPPHRLQAARMSGVSRAGAAALALNARATEKWT
ncbi:MAG: transposase [Terriglobia bacterium]